MFKKSLTLIGSIALCSAMYANDFNSLDDTVISSSKLTDDVLKMPSRVTIINQETIKGQLNVVNSVSELLYKLVPGFNTARNNLTAQGENFRGRKALYLIDGIPQNTPLFAGGRISETIDASQIERIEIIHGPSLAQGMGALGGTINIITKKSNNDDTVQNISLGLKLSGFKSEGLSYDLGYDIDMGLGDDLRLNAGFNYKMRGLNHDSSGNPIGLELVQGDLADSKGYDVFLKTSYAISDEQNLKVMFNNFNVAGNGEYSNKDGNRKDEKYTQAIKKPLPIGQAAENKVLNASIDYSHSGLFDGDLKTQAFYQDFSAIYGIYAGMWYFDPKAPAQDIVPEQTDLVSNKYGLKINYIKPLSDMIKIGTGVEYSVDETAQKLVRTKAYYTPPMTYQDLSPYLLANVELGGTTINTGMRYTSANLNINDFTTITTKNWKKKGQGLEANVPGVDIKGGNPSYSKLLFNVGATHQTDSFRAYGSYNQGFGIGEVGRVLRGLKKSVDLNNFLDISPIVTNNYEVGADYFINDSSSVGAEYFISSSDFGQGLKYIAEEDLYRPERTKTNVSGFNLKADLDFDSYQVGGSYSHITSKKDHEVKDENGQVTKTIQLDLEARGNSVSTPNKLNLFAQGSVGENLFVRLQSQTLLGKTLELKPDVSKKFMGYTTIDALGSYQLSESSQISFGIANLLNENYGTWYSQIGQKKDKMYLAGEGRSFKISYKMAF